ncbi:carbohydrate/purine kinase [Niveomyces insectorum RCEF 264]|uniref:Carbohydrate/purine kinase n=1 Tax=Niveomyces insectorum RCEF 264 TaxID=1081102 RepID=A0A167MHH8_9HYPO|nr:carbohydrate/purine kinase [Niveomyces insectorum RCEF 264]
MTSPPAFVSLGMVVVDELRRPGTQPMYDIPGGSGMFSVLGARLASGRAHAETVGCFVLAGYDFPEAVLCRVREWAVQVALHVDDSKVSTRGLLEYKDAEFSRKVFRYTTTPLQPTPDDLPPHFRLSSSFHMLADPAAVERQVHRLLHVRMEVQANATAGGPLLVWEPAPLFCNTSTRDAHVTACRLVDVFSPNHLELLSFFRSLSSHEDTARISRREIEDLAEIFLASGIGPMRQGAIVIRAGYQGCLVSSPQITGHHCWLPAFSDASLHVADATGAGNTFLGALTFSLAFYKKGIVEAAKFATVAASFALEQIGLPELQSQEGGKEHWNGSEFHARYERYMKQLDELPDTSSIYS